MSVDIGQILEGWPYDPGQLSARRIIGRDGKEKIQLRLELGLLQMEVVGRPDGQRPHGFDSLLEYHQNRLHLHKQEHGGDSGFRLSPSDCEQLRSEAMMYYHRYLAEFVLEEFQAVERDTARNLRAMDFCRDYAAQESDRLAMEQHRPYVIMMCSRSRGRLALKGDRPAEALTAVRKGIERIKHYYRQFGQEEMIESSGEIAILDATAKEIELRIPPDPVQKLREKLGRAVREERYEDAASLRDQLRRATGEDPATPKSLTEGPLADLP